MSAIQDINLTPNWCSRLNWDNGVARIFFWGGATRPIPSGRFCVISGSRPDSVGGVVAENFRDLHKQARFAGGGGSCDRHFFR